MSQSLTDRSPAAQTGDDVVLSVRDLQVVFPTTLGEVHALNGVSLDVRSGRVLGIVGESGSGKSVTARAILQIIEKPGKIAAGSIRLKHDPGSDAAVEITRLDPDSALMRSLRGKEIAMIFQEPMSSLNPVFTIGAQIEEAILIHQTKDKREAAARAVDMLRQVGMPNPEGAARSYPHQLSGGMRQRAMIAMALSCNPRVLIADEPTTALDVTTEAQILELIEDVKDQTDMAVMFITHSMGVVAQLCDEVVVMYLGRVMERAPVDDIFHDPKHPYTKALLRSIPRIGDTRGKPLEVIHGSVPDPYTTVAGCPFHPRCPDMMPGICDVGVLTETSVSEVHQVSCHLYDPDRIDQEHTPAMTSTSHSDSAPTETRSGS